MRWQALIREGGDPLPPMQPPGTLERESDQGKGKVIKGKWARESSQALGQGKLVKVKVKRSEESHGIDRSQRTAHDLHGT